MGDRDGRIEPFSINMNPGDVAPRWDEATHELTPLYVTITERGMQSGLPMVDMVFEGHDGKRHAFTTSGRMMLMVAGAVQSAVVRNRHEPDYVPTLVLALEGRHPQAPTFDKALAEIAGTIQAELIGRMERPLDVEEEVFRDAVKAALLDVIAMRGLPTEARR